MKFVLMAYKMVFIHKKSFFMINFVILFRSITKILDFHFIIGVNTENSNERHF